MHTPPPFTPARWLRNPHLQTILAARLRFRRGVHFRRERIDTPDGDFIDLDFAIVNDTPLPRQAPLTLLLHGLEGSARRGYACQTYRQLARHGIRGVGMNFRSCSGEMNRTARMYHAGATDDVAFAHDYLDDRYPEKLQAMIGVSLGGNMLLKYLGEQGANLAGRLRVAVAVSPPFDLAAGAIVMEQGTGRPYSRYLLRGLRRKAHQKAATFNDLVDVERARQARTIREFDELVIAPLYGFADAWDYYGRMSCGQFLGDVAVPTLLIRALDDPFFDPDDIPHETIATNPHLQAAFTDHGGHVGFLERPGRFWAERTAAEFIANTLTVVPENDPR